MDLEQQLEAATATIHLLQESLADVESSFAREDRGWSQVGQRGDEFTHQARKAFASQARIAAIIDPLIKRAASLRTAYIWAGGVQVAVRDDADNSQDVNAVVQAFWDDEDVQETFSSLQALIGHERQLGTDGELFFALPVDARTGRVWVRSLPPAEFEEIVYDPEDAARPWFYRRTYTPAAKGAVARTVMYPALSYRPSQRVPEWDGHPIRWDSPVLHVAVNKVKDRGVGDLLAALPWAKAYKGFLTDWAGLMRALSRIALKVRTRGDRTRQAAEKIASLTEVGSGVALTGTDELEALSTSGARFDADSGRPLAVMIAAAVDLPVTTLLGDPGVTGARATAENVAAESWAPFEVRQDLWAGVFKRIVGFVIDAAVIAPAGALRGTIVRDGDRMYARLPEGDSRTVVVSFPDHDDTNLLDRVRAIVAASQTETVPPLVTLRLLLQALEVSDMDEVLDMVTDDNGEFIPLDVLDQRVRARLGDRGDT